MTLTPHIVSVLKCRSTNNLWRKRAGEDRIADLIVGGPEHVADDLGRVGAWLSVAVSL